MEVQQAFTVECNTPDKILKSNIETNCALGLPWLASQPEHEGHAVICGSGPSLADCIETIKWRQSLGQKIFALNGAAKFLTEHGITVDFQIMVDARAENARFVGYADHYLLASQCAPTVVNYAAFIKGMPVTLWHSITSEADVPERDAPWDAIGGGTTVGLSAMCVVYTMGYRLLHLFGYDSSHRETAGHAFQQSLNKNDHLCNVTVGGKVYRCSLAMAKQAELFPLLQNEFLDRGCTITIDGDGLLPAMVRAQAPLPTEEFIAECDKYRRMWEFADYRKVSPGEDIAARFVEIAQITGRNHVVDFGCGTGRGSARIHSLTGCQILQIDFADNCRDAGMHFPFLRADLTNKYTFDIAGDIGFCADVMEHIPTEDVKDVIHNIMDTVDKCFFQISLTPDHMGALIGHPLHMTVKPCKWWADLFTRLGYVVRFAEDQQHTALFYISNT